MPSVAQSQEKPSPRGALYIDGFNLYHAICGHKENFLKWLNLWRLGEILCDRAQFKLVKVVFCTALTDWDSPSKRRHITYNNALIASGVSVIKGHHIVDPDSGKTTEKQSDVNLALSVFCGAMDDVYDAAFLLTADSDQAATGRFLGDRFPNKGLFSVSPPNRPSPKKLLPFCKGAFSLSVELIEHALFRGTVLGRHGLIVRPKEYDPPHGWVHPDLRPIKLQKGKI
jgi:hypothetical protein